MKRTLVFAALFFACAPSESPTAYVAPGTTATTTDDIADVEHSIVKRQSIGNCWLYATASWAESLHKTASGEELNLSESYWTYWHWFEQIADDGADSISTGGTFSVSSNLIRNYGYMLEGDFIASEATVEMSWMQHTALDAINASLKSGKLSTAAARSDRALVRKELDKAWSLAPEVSAALDDAFGADVATTLAWGSALPDDSLIGDPAALSTAKTSPGAVQGQPVVTQTTLKDSLNQWREASYPSWYESSKRPFLKRLQRAVHDRAPLIITWFVDFNSLDDHGRFAAPPTTPGRQGGHMVVIEDYQINDVPGFGTLAAGTLVTDPAALDAALANTAKIEFIRVKNSWGSYRPDREFVAGFAGYHDLYMAYLDATIKQCKVKADGESDPTDCPYTRVPFTSVIFPNGY